MKRALKIIGFTLGLLVSSIIILAFLVDANIFKPRIETLAKQQGIALAMRGDLHWAFWPSIGIAVQDVSVADLDAPEKTIAHVDKASFLMAFIPLMRGDFQVKHVLVDGANIDLIVNEQGVGNWEQLAKPKAKVQTTTPVKTSAEVSSDDLKLQIEKISLHNSMVSYFDMAKDQKLTLKDIDLDIDNVNMNGDPFAMNFSWMAQLSQTKSNAAPLTIKGKLHNKIALSAGFNTVALTDGELKLDLTENASAQVTLKYVLKLNDVKTNLRYEGDISLPSMNAKKLLSAFGSQLVTANDKALTDVSVAASFSGDKKQAIINALQIQLDKTHIKGTAAINDFSTQQIKLDIQGDTINVDDYLAPAPKTDEKAAAVASTATGNEPLIPMEMLRKLNADVKAGFNKMIIVGLSLEKIQLDVNAKNGLVQQQLNANAYSGKIQQKSGMDVRGQAAQMRFDSTLQNIEIAPILKDKKLDKSLNLSGAILANASGQASGVTKNQIMDSLTANANFSGAKIRLSSLNIEQQFCKLVTMVSKADEPVKTWETFTEMRELSGKINIAKRIITIETFNAGVEKLMLGSTGNINLINGSYDFFLPLKLIRDENDTPTSVISSKDGCTVTSNFWVERGMSLLRCKGAYAAIDPKNDCRPDKDALASLTKDYAAYKLREKYGEKADAKKAELQQKLNDKLGGEEGKEKAKNLLKNFFNKKNNDK